jgi:hypothetical protein
VKIAVFELVQTTPYTGQRPKPDNGNLGKSEKCGFAATRNHELDAVLNGHSLGALPFEHTSLGVRFGELVRGGENSVKASWNCQTYRIWNKVGNMDESSQDIKNSHIVLTNRDNILTPTVVIGI